jgi:hypothetical protein
MATHSPGHHGPRAKLIRAKFIRAKLIRAKFIRAKLIRAKFIRAKLAPASHTVSHTPARRMVSHTPASRRVSHTRHRTIRGSIRRSHLVPGSIPRGRPTPGNTQVSTLDHRSPGTRIPDRSTAQGRHRRPRTDRTSSQPAHPGRGADHPAPTHRRCGRQGHLPTPR